MENMDRTEPKEYSGISVSKGISIGQVHLYYSRMDDLPDYSLDTNALPAELDRYFAAVNEVDHIFLSLQKKIARDLGSHQGEIYETYHLMLEDPLFTLDIPEAIRFENRNAESVIRRKLKSFEQQFLEVKNEYLRERVYDIRGVGRKVIYHLMQKDGINIEEANGPQLIFAQELTPADSIHFHHRMLKGIVTEFGGKTSHAAILARSLEIPALVGVKNLLKNVEEGQTAILDGLDGIVIIDPEERTLNEYKKRLKDYQRDKKKILSVIDKPLNHLTGKKIKLLSNLNDITELESFHKYPSDGIGLYRTELEFIARDMLLSENEQFYTYKKVIESLPGKEITIRVLDIGGDKFLPFSDAHAEANPFLGMRSIRILLREKNVFKSQLRAIFRASVYGDVKILIPMISSHEEIIRVKEIVEEVKNELRSQKIDFNEKTPLGIMVEIPSAAITIDSLIQEVDFISIGTNDLIQYTLAVDRNNEKVADFYQPLNPAVIELIEKVASAGKKYNKRVSICGEVAGEPVYTQLMLSLGITELSMPTAYIPIIKYIILHTTDKDLEEITKIRRTISNVAELHHYLSNRIKTL